MAHQPSDSLVVWLLLSSLVAMPASANPDKIPPSLGLTMDLKVKNIELRVGESLACEVKITNRGKKTVTLVAPGDGSQHGWRTPITGGSVLSLESTKKHATRPTPSKAPRCGNMNGLKKDEVFTLKPGQSKKLQAWTTLGPFEAAGKYRVILLYENQPSLKWPRDDLGLAGPHDKEALQKVKTSSKCLVVSNEIIITAVK